MFSFPKKSLEGNHTAVEMITCYECSKISPFESDGVGAVIPIAAVVSDVCMFTGSRMFTRQHLPSQVSTSTQFNPLNLKESEP